MKLWKYNDWYLLLEKVNMTNGQTHPINVSYSHTCESYTRVAMETCSCVTSVF